MSEMLDKAYTILYSVVLTAFSVMIFAMLVRSVIGPRITDRILSINMIGTMVISCIAICSLLLDESYLLDVALIYALVSFVSVLIFTRIYVPLKPDRGTFGPDAFADIRSKLEREETQGDRSETAQNRTAKKRKGRKG